MGRRIQWLGVVLLICFALVIVQLLNIQGRQASELDSTGHNPREIALEHDNPRGLILAANGTVLAESKRTPGTTSGAWQYYRYYPTGTLFAGVVGYASEYRGVHGGVESTYDAYLTAHTPPPATVGELLGSSPATTDDVTLTVQPSVQAAARAALAAVPGTDKDGAVVVLDPKTGAVLADYSSPSFDPNALSTPDLSHEIAAAQEDFTTKDHEGFTPGVPMATYDTFLPGSTFKVVTSAAVYDLKPTLATYDYPVVKCTTTAVPLPTSLRVCNDTDTPGGASACGGTMVEMLPVSCDPGYATLGLKLGATLLSEQAEAFGYDTRPPIDLPTTVVSASRFPAVADLQEGRSPGPGGVPLAAFGQGTVSTTALQGAMVAAGIADAGVVMTPHVMAEIRNAQGGLVRSSTPTVYKRAATAAAASQVRQLMQRVVTTPHGTAYGVGFTPKEDVAVKTGTAQVHTPPTTVNDWMIGFAPASDPTVAVAVVVPEQPTTTSGATVAGPVFKAVLQAALAAT